MNDLEEFRREVAAWLTANRPPEPGFLLPESFMEVGSDAQFNYLRDWQRKIYEAGYLGMAWPKVYGGGGRPQIYQDIANAEMARLKVPFVPNTIGLPNRRQTSPGSVSPCFIHHVRSGAAASASGAPVRS